MLSKEVILRINRELNLEIDGSFVKEIYLYDGDKLEQPRQCLITGDNLYSLMSLLKADVRIKVAYVDPPYNTGRSFVYKDKFESTYHPIWGNSKNWVEFMIVRMLLLKFIMKDNGFVIFSIDDREMHNLIRLADYIFGFQNRLPTIVVKKNNHGKGSQKEISNQHEYMVIYKVSEDSKILGLIESAREHKTYDKSDGHGNFRINGLFRKKGDASLRKDRPNMFYPLFYDEDGKVYSEFQLGLKTSYPIDSSGIERRWLWTTDKVKRDNHLLYASKKGIIYVKDYDRYEKTVTPRSVWDSVNYFTQNGTSELKSDLGDERVFENPKSIPLMLDMLSLFPIIDDDTLLDVFSGSGSFTIAAHQSSVRAGVNTNLIALESNDLIPLKHTARAVGYEYIYEITLQRLKKHLDQISIINLN